MKFLPPWLVYIIASAMAVELHAEEQQRIIAYPAKAIVGHWRNGTSGEEYWLDGSRITKETVDGNQVTYQYKVIKNGKGQPFTVVQLKTNLSTDFDKEWKLALSPDKRSLETSARDISSSQAMWSSGDHWLYIDSASTPSESGLNRSRSASTTSTSANAPEKRSQTALPQHENQGPASMTNWQARLIELLGLERGDLGTAQELIDLFPKLLPAQKVKAADRIGRWVNDSDYEHLLPLLGNTLLDVKVQRVLYKDLLGRDDKVRLPALLKVAKLDAHSCHIEALAQLGEDLHEKHGSNWGAWETGINEFIAKKYHVVELPIPVAPAENSISGTSNEPKGLAANAKAAAQEYITELKERGVVFEAEFQAIIVYPQQTVADAIYSCNYLNQAGMKVQGPYTIEVTNRAGAWVATGTTAGDRRKRLNDPVIGLDGQWQRSPMEQATQDAINRGMSTPNKAPR